jgi:uncharacterized protein (TIRG00374 family)
VDRQVSKRTLFNLFKYLLALGLLVYVVYDNWSPASGKGLVYVWERHVNQGQPIHAPVLLLACALFLASLLITLVRWYVLVRAQDVPFTITAALRLGTIGYFFNTFLPGSVGGDIIKAAGLAREQSRRTVAVATVIMDRVIALWGLIWIVTLLGGVFWAAGMLEGPAEQPSKLIVSTTAVIVGVSVSVWLLLGLLPANRAKHFALKLARRGKVGASAAEFGRAVWMYRCRQSSVVLALLLALISHASFVASFYCGAHALLEAEPGNPMPSLLQHFLIVPLGMVIQTVPLFPGGAGIGELGFGGLYAWFQCPAANGVLASLMSRVISWVIGVLGLIACSLLPARAAPDAELVTPVNISPVPAAAGIPNAVGRDREDNKWPS